ncbi:MAG: phospholipase D-like domain-containing protein [Vicinamibacterales bacterium]
MRLSVINQYPALKATGSRLQTLIGEFADRPMAQFRCLVAFASEQGLQQVEDCVLDFLRRGGSIYFIVGVDLGGTSREALERLLSWKRAFPRRVDARVFSTADNATIFHPKVYWFDSTERRVVIVGSANATNGGLLKNFEVSLEMELEPSLDGDAFEDLDFLWMTYSSPLPPLSETNLLEIDASLVARLKSGRPPTDGNAALPHPLAGLRRAGPAKPKVPPKKATDITGGVELVMDILEETRRTQVQLPVGALPFFNAEPERTKSINLHQVFRGNVVKSDKRPFIHLDNNTHRLEIDAIRGLPRPQIVRFWHATSDSRNVHYEVLLRGTRRYAEADSLLRRAGRQTRVGARRWLVRRPAAGGVSSKRKSR